MNTIRITVSIHKLSWSSWVSLLDSGILCVYLLDKAPPTCCYHGDGPSWVGCLQGGEFFSVWNSVRKLEGGRGRRVTTRVCVCVTSYPGHTQYEKFPSYYVCTRLTCVDFCVVGLNDGIFLICSTGL